LPDTVYTHDTFPETSKGENTALAFTSDLVWDNNIDTLFDTSRELSDASITTSFFDTSIGLFDTSITTSFDTFVDFETLEHFPWHNEPVREVCAARASILNQEENYPLENIRLELPVPAAAASLATTDDVSSNITSPLIPPPSPTHSPSSPLSLWSVAGDLPCEWPFCNQSFKSVGDYK
jgi:hypothetical protein